MLTSMFRKTLFCLMLFVANLGNISHLCADQLRESELIKFIEQSIQQADQKVSKLTPAVFALQGMSSAKVRCLLNNLCSMPNTSYLEIGVWQGSTFISALHGNQSSMKQAVAIDDWSQFSGPKKKFEKNCAKFLKRKNYKFYSSDCFKVDTSTIFNAPINIYFYDGEHSSLSQELALTYYAKALDDLFILIVDDWNWDSVQEGTRNGLKKLNYRVVYERALSGLPAEEQWWNGIYVALIAKN